MVNNNDKSEQELDLINSLKYHADHPDFTQENKEQRSALYEKLAIEKQERLQEENLDSTLDQGISLVGQQNTKDDFDDTNVENTPGAILKHARLKLGLSIHDVATQLCLRINTIADIENERLNQPTSVTFARGNITRYARLVRVPEEVVQKLYDENVERTKAKTISFEQTRRRTNHSKYLALLALVIVLVGVVLYINDGTVSEEYIKGEQEVGSLDMAANETDMNNVTNDTTAMSTVTNTTAANTSNINTQNTSTVDRNTQLATEQARALGTNEIQTLTNLGKGPQDMSAVLDQKSNYIVDKQTKAQDTNTNTQIKVSAATNNKNIDTSKQNNQNSTVANNNNDKKTAETVELADNLRDLSDRVKIQYRQGLASLNEVIVSINGTVAVKIIDSRNKIIKQGVFKDGDGFKVQGIPPIRIETSDSSLMSISYRGGSVVVPKQKQVSFILPIN